jgi:hypothetical protein
MIVIAEAPLCHVSMAITAGLCPGGPGFADAGRDEQTGNLRAVQILLGHTKIESTIRYLGVDIEDAFALAEGTEV